MAYRRDIFKPNQPFAMGAEQDFNKVYGLNPGDQVELADGMEYLYIGRLNGITFVAPQTVEIGSITFPGTCISPKLIGSLINNFPTIRLTKKDRFGVGWEAVGDMEIANVHSIGQQQGIQVLTKPENTYPLSYQNIYIHHCLIEDTAFEAMYLGHYIAGSPAWISGRVENNVIKRAGNDGIQCRNGYFAVTGNHLEEIGLGGNDSHSQGILFGGNTKNGVARGNTLKGVRGYGIFANGFGDFIFESNNIQSASSGVFTKNHEPQEDIQKVGYQRFAVVGNTIEAGNGKSIESYYQNTGIPSTVIYQDNITAQKPYIEPGVTFVQVVPADPIVTPPTTPVKKLLWTAYKVIDGKKKYYNVYSDYTWQWK